MVRSIITVIIKKKDKEDWLVVCAISMLNVDYNIYTSIISEKNEHIDIRNR